MKDLQELINESRLETFKNLDKSFHNAGCSLEDIKPYSNEAFLNVVSEVNKLLEVYKYGC